MYEIMDMNGEKIVANFYAEEMSVVKGNNFIIDKVKDKKRAKMIFR